MKKILGITLVLAAVCVFATLREPNFLSAYNIQNIIGWTSLYGILGVGVAFVIITGGIDLSIGSVVGLVGCLLPWLLVEKGWSAAAAVPAVLAVAVVIGFGHGLLITKVRLQPFVVTLCGLMVYRGLARWLTADKTQGFGSGHEDLLALAGAMPLPGTDDFKLPKPALVLIALTVAGSVFLNCTVWGRWLLALGRNEQAARFSGIRTDRMVIAAYVICSACAGIGGVLFSLDIKSIQPAGHGNAYELFAIAAAVLGGCSLRGGEGSIVGVVIGTALIRVLYNATNVMGIATQLEMTILGVVILVGVLIDEMFRRISAARAGNRGA